MTQKKNMRKRKKREKHTQISFFLQNCKQIKMEIFALCVITFEPIKI